MENPGNRLSKKTLFAYGCGDFASNLCWTFVGSYLSVFYTDVVGMAPAIASMIMLIAKIWDGVNDPMFGMIAERTNSKKGRFRPYIFYGAPFLALFSVLTFTTFGKGSAAVGWAAFSYIGCGMLYTVVNLSYGSLSTVMTTNAEDIAQLNSYRMMGTNISSVLLNAITAPMLAAFSAGSQGYTAKSYTIVAIIFALCAIPIFYFVYANCKETIQPQKTETRIPISKSLKSVLGNGPLMLLFLIQLIAMTAFFGRMGVVIYYLMYDVQRMDLVAVFMSLPSLMTVIGILITKNHMVTFGKKKMAAIGYIGAGLSLILIYIVGNTMGYSNIPVSARGILPKNQKYRAAPHIRETARQFLCQNEVIDQRQCHDQGADNGRDGRGQVDDALGHDVVLTGFVVIGVAAAFFGLLVVTVIAIIAFLIFIPSCSVIRLHGILLFMIILFML